MVDRLEIALGPIRTAYLTLIPFPKRTRGDVIEARGGDSPSQSRAVSISPEIVHLDLTLYGPQNGIIWRYRQSFAVSTVSKSCRLRQLGFEM